jgi:hypothetical protein
MPAPEKKVLVFFCRQSFGQTGKTAQMILFGCQSRVIFVVVFTK